MSIEYNVIGRHIRAARKEQKMTQETVAEKLGISVVHFGKVERGDRPINLQRLSEISLLLNTPLEKLVEGAVPIEGEISTHMSSSENMDYLDSIRTIAKGCSKEAMRLMLQLCIAVAENDKSRRSV